MLDATRFRVLTRSTPWRSGLQRDEIPDLVRWSHGCGFDLVIETLPMGGIDALSLVRARLELRFTLHDIPYKSGEPAPLWARRRDRRRTRLHHAAH